MPGLRIVGLVENSLYDDPRGVPPPLFYLPRPRDSGHGEMTFYVSSAVAPDSILPQLASRVAALDPDLPIEHLSTLAQRVDATLVVENFVGMLAIAFAVLATLLASIGLYGLMSYTLSQRIRELGLRLALGAAPHKLRAMLMAQVARLTLIGSVLGIAAALLLGRAAQSLLFGLDGLEPLAFVLSAVLLGLVALASGWLPARRAARIDPMPALRQD
jgi:ABC-type antimicrobial peptide transport system permease subunit